MLLLLWAAQALAQPVELFVGPPVHAGARAVFPEPAQTRVILRVPAQVDVRRPYAVTQLQVTLSSALAALLQVRYFDTQDTPWPLPDDFPDSALRYYLSAFGGNASLSMSVRDGRVLARLTFDGLLFTVEGAASSAQVTWYDPAFFAIDDVYPPFPPVQHGDQQLTMAWDGPPGRVSPGSGGQVQLTVRNHGPDATAGGAVIFDQAPLQGRLHLVSEATSLDYRWGSCGTASFPIPGLPSSQVLRVYVPVLAAGESITCTVPATLLGWRDATLRAQLHPRNPTHFFEDPQLGNNVAELVITGAGAPPPLPPVRVPGPSLAWLGALVVLMLGSAASVSRRLGP